MIWDKKTRLDNVYGSTGSKLTIYDVIKRLDGVDYTPNVDVEDEVHRVGKNNSNKSSTTLEPNYFISIPINNSIIRENFFNLTNNLIVSSSGQLEDFIVPQKSLHLTLCTLRINDKEEIEQVKKVFDSLNSEKEFLSENMSINFKFKGLGSFYDKVLYAKCECDNLDKVKNLRKKILDKLEEAKLSLAGNYYEFVPHLTVLKISASAFKNSNNSNKFSNLILSELIDEEVLSDYKNYSFGEQDLNEIELCKMVNIFSQKTYPVEYTLNVKDNLIEL